MKKMIHWLSQFGVLIDALTGIFTFGLWSFNLGLRIEFRLSQRRLARLERKLAEA